MRSLVPLPLVLLALACQSPSATPLAKSPEPAAIAAQAPAAEPTAPPAVPEPAPPPAEPQPAAPRADSSQPGFHKDFSDAAAFSRAFDDPGRDAWQRPAEVIEHLHVPAGSVVVDLGAGTGYFVERLSNAVGPKGQVLALDVEAKMVDFVEQRAEKHALANVTARVVAPDDPGLSDGSVARILIVNTWHHIDDRAAYAKKLARALAPGGEIWVVDFTPDSDLGPPRPHRIPAEQVELELEQGGLQAEIIAEQLPKQYMVRAWYQ